MQAKNDEHGMPSVSIVMGYLAVKDYATIEKKVEVLSMLGYGRSEMAKICGTTVNTVSVAISKLKSKRKNNKE